MNDDISATDDEVGLDEDIEPGAEAAEGVKGGVRLRTCFTMKGYVHDLESVGDVVDDWRSWKAASGSRSMTSCWG